MMRHLLLALALFSSGVRADSSDDARPPTNPYDIPWWHPKIEHVLRNRIAGPANHPPINSAMHAYIRAHTDEDHEFNFDGSNGWVQRPRRYPGDHPNMDIYFVTEPAPRILPVSVFAYHPDSHAAYLRGEAIPNSHPSVQGMMESILPEDHPDVDDMLRNPSGYPMPDWHPNLSDMTSNRNEEADYPAISVFLGHPDVGSAYTNGQAIPRDHPVVHSMFDGHLPENHPDLDEILRSPAAYPLPDWHPPLNSMLTYSSDSPGGGGAGAISIVSVYRGHPDISEAYAEGEEIPSWHPPVHSMFDGHLPEVHPDIDAMLRSPADYPLPSWHPPLNAMVDPQSAWSPGLVFVLAVSALLALAVVVRVARRVTSRYKDSKAAAMELHNHQFAAGFEDEDSRATVMERHNDQFTAGFEDDFETLPRRRLNFREMDVRNATHRAEHPMYDYERVAPGVPRTSIAREKSSADDGAVRSLKSRAMTTRIPGTQWASGNLILCAAYVLLNALALVLRLDYGVDRGLGSLAAANTVFVVVAATRNSVLTWFLGLPFDRVILYHRFVGRVTVAAAFLHFAWYFGRLLDHAAEYTYWTGLAALGCGVGIVLTTTNWARRNHFNVFYWSHYLFLGFFVLVYLHAPQAQPFILASVGFYAVDKALRVLWTLLPVRTTIFRYHEDSKTARVRFQKNALTKLMGKRRVGQYMFVNFPELSLTEWHPFSVSSGPSEDAVELHIRALGDHTRDVVNLSRRCARTNRQVWIRADGPYGYLGFDYHRYGVLLLVGGGIGVTPIISMLRDIYGPHRSREPHCIRRVYAVWVMPRQSEASLFANALREFEAAAASDDALPDLTVAVHCTRGSVRSERLRETGISASRPDFPSIMEACEVEYSQSPTLVFACGPGKMVNDLWDECGKRNKGGMRVDFHHETFEF